MNEKLHEIRLWQMYEHCRFATENYRTAKDVLQSFVSGFDLRKLCENEMVRKNFLDCVLIAMEEYAADKIERITKLN